MSSDVYLAKEAQMQYETILSRIRSGFLLVLSGGAARGMAHLGFLQALREWRAPVRALVGTSSGAIAGSIFANPKCSIDDIRIRIGTLNRRDIYRFAWSRSGIFDAQNSLRLLENAVGPDTTFESLSIPFVATATSLKSRKLVFLDSGGLASAIAASSALPPLFTPICRDGDIFVDGGVVSILPVLGAKSLHPALPVVSVDVNAYRERQGIPDPFPERRTADLSRSPLNGNWLSLSIRLYFLGLYRTLQLESSVSDWHVEVPGGQYPLSDRSHMDILFKMGYDSGAKLGRLLKG